MKKTNGFKKGSFKIAARLECGKHCLQEVSGYIMGDIGLDQRTKGNWRATHIPSGLAITIGSFGYNTRQEAFEEAKKILETLDKSVLQKGIEQFQSLLKDFESEKANPAEDTNNPEPETTADLESTVVVEAPEPEPQPTMPMFDGVTVQAFRFGKKLNRIKLTFTGNTKPHKEAIKAMGRSWWNGALSRWEVDVTGTALAANIRFIEPQAA